MNSKIGVAIGFVIVAGILLADWTFGTKLEVLMIVCCVGLLSISRAHWTVWLLSSVFVSALAGVCSKVPLTEAHPFLLPLFFVIIIFGESNLRGASYLYADVLLNKICSLYPRMDEGIFLPVCYNAPDE